jgi:ribonucleotide monophosphatase NagD (HAD superfamily)
MTIRLLEGVASVAGAYDAFIVDLWGVLHDGAKPLPGTVECLGALKAAGKRVVLLSNAPRPAAPAIARLTEIGFAREL